MNRNTSFSKMNYWRLISNTAITLLFLAFLLSGISCDNTDLFTFAEKTGNYGPTWSPYITFPSAPDMSTGTVTVAFPDDVINADLLDNYLLTCDYSGTGINISPAYVAGLNNIVTIGLQFTGTNGSGFCIELVTSEDTLGNSTCITDMAGHVIDGYLSPSYHAPDLIAPSVTWNPDPGTYTLQAGSEATIRISFSEPVKGADTSANYQVIQGGVTLAQNFSYNAGTRTATLRFTPGNTVNALTIYNNNITDYGNNSAIVSVTYTVTIP
jgi:hypothetical protein